MLLFVDCCISYRGDRSRSHALCEAFLESYKKAHPAEDVEVVNLQRMALKPFDVEMLNERDALASVGAWDAPVFDLPRQFRGADAILVAAPFWDMSFPAALRTYIEYISANGLTYHYDETGCHGDCKAERLVYLTSGGDFEREDSVGVVYWRQLAAMFGVPRFDYVFAGGLDAAPEKAEETLAGACALAEQLAREA